MVPLFCGVQRRFSYSSANKRIDIAMASMSQRQPDQHDAVHGCDTPQAIGRKSSRLIVSPLIIHPLFREKTIRGRNHAAP
ncbi:MAG: hypothetical protein R3D32_07160 [Nitratireductor sp.]